MSSSHHHEASGPVDTVALGHETRDTRARPLVYGVIATFGLLIISYLLIAGLLAVADLAPNDPGTSNFIPEPAVGDRLPTGPLLQQDGDLEGDLYIAEQAELLEQYAVDPTSGRISIPIERAMELVVERGLSGASE